MTKARWKLPLLLFLGSLLMQAAWVLAIPPFRGIDEFDHAYRAAAVARGEWHPSPATAPDTRGELVTIPRDIVEAAAPVCRSLRYTGPGNCQAVDDAGDGLVTVSSGAARYNPVFYWFIGTAARPFEGYTALYAMRLAAMTLCSLFIASAGWCLAQWSRTRWPMIGLVVALTPVFMYSTSVAAPNGLEMCAGLALWAALLGLTRCDLPTAVERRLLIAAIAPAVVLSTLRLLGVGWLALIVLCVAALLGLGRIRELIRDHTSTLAWGVLVITGAVFGALYWVMTARQVSPDPSITPETSRLTQFANTLEQVPLWILQSIAAFPARNDDAPPVVYAIGVLTFGTALVIGLRQGRGRYRTVLGLATAAALIVPFAATLVSYERVGPIWQGRYGLPFCAGIALLVALILDRHEPHHRLLRPAVQLLLSLLVLQHVISAVFTLGREVSRSRELLYEDGWIVHPWWVVAVLMSLGFALWVRAITIGAPPWRHADSVDATRDAAVSRQMASARSE